MILKHYTLKCENNLTTLKKELDKIDDGIKDLNIEVAYVNQNSNLVLEIYEKSLDEIIKIKDE